MINSRRYLKFKVQPFLIDNLPYQYLFNVLFSLEAEFKEFELWLKYGWFHFKLYSMFQDLS